MVVMLTRPICAYCCTKFIPVGNETICDLCADEGITIDEPVPHTVRGFPANPHNACRTIASCTVLDHAPTGSTRDEYFEMRRELATKYGGRKGYADMSDFEDRCPFDPKDPDGSNEASDNVIYNIIHRCVEIRRNGKP